MAYRVAQVKLTHRREDTTPAAERAAMGEIEALLNAAPGRTLERIHTYSVDGGEGYIPIAFAIVVIREAC
jgi:hypothetical protein